MTPPALHLRATDADRERVAHLLRVAAGEGALTVDELEERISAAYSAVTRADLISLVDDLPESHTPPAPAPPPHAPRSSSLFWVWGSLPFFAAAAWVHAGFLTRVTRYWLLAAVYAIPLVLAAVAAPGTDDELPGWVSAIAVAFWITNAIHAWTARATVNADWARVQRR